ncbi:hypothetical protein K439DRAFT_1624865 [Ramaria rubella]|nr:hypothetical protein K439DRAFT_1624865 [Ramaria rubella]
MPQWYDSCILDAAEPSCEVGLAISPGFGGTARGCSQKIDNPQCGSSLSRKCDQNHTKRNVKDVLLRRDDSTKSPYDNGKYSIDIVPPVEPTSAAQQYSVIIESHAHQWLYKPSTVATVDLPSSDDRIVPLNINDNRYCQKESTGICTKTLPVCGSIGAQAEDSPESSTVEPSFENDGRGVNDSSCPIPMQMHRDSTTVEQQHTPRSPAVKPSFKNDGQGVNDSKHVGSAGKNQQDDRVVAFPNNFRPSSQDDGRVRVVQDQGRSPRPRSVMREVSSTVVGTDIPARKPQWYDLRVACSFIKAS